MHLRRKFLISLTMVLTLSIGSYLLFREGPVEVTVFRVKRGDVESTVTATTTGTAKARASSKISSQYTGRIAKIYKREGARVKRDEVIMELENSDAKAQVRLAEANLNAAKADLNRLISSRNMVVSQASAMVDETKARLDNAASNYDRAVSLYSTGMISRQEMDSAKAALDVAKADYENARANELQGKIKDDEILAAKARVKQMESNLELARIQLSHTYITAPYDGTILQIFVEEGELLIPMTVAAPILEIADESSPEVEAEIDEVDIGKLRLGQEVRLTFDAFKEKKFYGKIKEIFPFVATTKEQNRTVVIKVGIDTGQEGIKVGMSTDVEVITGIARGVPYIPTNSIIEKAEGQFVFVAEKGVAREKRIRTGLSNWDTTEVIEGLREGDEVITSLGVRRFEEGTKVKVVKRE
jgi:multidrug efflux pump subunit AcrA (membrane-fusion protein)